MKWFWTWFSMEWIADVNVFIGDWTLYLKLVGVSRLLRSSLSVFCLLANWTYQAMIWCWYGPCELHSSSYDLHIPSAEGLKKGLKANISLNLGEESSDLVWLWRLHKATYVTMTIFKLMNFEDTRHDPQWDETMHEEMQCPIILECRTFLQPLGEYVIVEKNSHFSTTLGLRSCHLLNLRGECKSTRGEEEIQVHSTTHSTLKWC